METTKAFIEFLQACISPMVLISGVGLLLLSISNRLGRTIDKSRMLVKQLQNHALDKERKIVQLKTLFKRSKILRLAIAAISISILSSSLIIPLLLIMNLCDLNLRILGIGFFLVSVFGIIISAVFLFIDVSLALKALDYEVRDYL
ncbi:DUF2721 domain-containing protein [Candidatus Margulisiibacteriota bacterium]